MIGSFSDIGTMAYFLFNKGANPVELANAGAKMQKIFFLNCP
jgi:hypothetical protein